MATIYTTTMCNLMVLDGVGYNTPESTVERVANGQTWQSSNKYIASFYVFNVADNRSGGKALRDYIHANKLGRVSKSKAMRNSHPNHIGDKYKSVIYVWAVDHKRLAEWLKKRTTVVV